jgi:hypothetical protein
LPQYHFHGLASTQTQSQHSGDAEEFDGGSQKENIATNRPSKDVGRLHASPPPRQSSPHTSTSKNPQDVALHGDSRFTMTASQKVCVLISFTSLCKLQDAKGSIKQKDTDGSCHLSTPNTKAEYCKE